MPGEGHNFCIFCNPLNVMSRGAPTSFTQHQYFYFYPGNLRTASRSCLVALCKTNQQNKNMKNTNCTDIPSEMTCPFSCCTLGFCYFQKSNGEKSTMFQQWQHQHWSLGTASWAALPESNSLTQPEATHDAASCTHLFLFRWSSVFGSLALLVLILL